MTSGQALAATTITLVVGGLAGLAMRSCWAMMIAPAVFGGEFEVTRLGGQTVRPPTPSTLRLPVRCRLRAHRDILTRSHRHGPAARPATSTALLVASDAATPITRLAVDTIPLFAPSTAARSQPTSWVR